MKTIDPDPVSETNQPAIISHSSVQPFSHLQWYLHHAKNTVYLAAESDQELGEGDLHTIAGLFMQLAPQLQSRADTKGNRHIGINTDPKTICTYMVTNDLNRSLVEILEAQDSIYADPDLPNFRAYGFTLARPKKNEPKSLYVCCSSHALMEGSESARIMRTRKSVHHAGRTEVKLGFIQRLAIAVAGLLLAPFHLLASAFNRKDTSNGKWAVIDIDRKSIKKLAHRYGVRQRSVLFSLPLFGLHPATNLPNRTKKKMQLVSYSTLPDNKTMLEDSALNLRMQVGRIPTADDFEAQVAHTDKVLNREDTTEVYSQAFYNSILGMHRLFHRVCPFLYTRRFFTYVPYDFVLSLLPPHIAGGEFRKMFNKSIFCGSYTPGVNNCVFVPYRNGISLNFYVSGAAYENFDAFVKFLNQLGIKCRRIV